MARNRKKLQVVNFSFAGYDKTLLSLTVLLSVLGLLAVTDASAPQALATFNDSYFFAKQQFKWLVIGSIFLGLGAIIDYRIWKKYAVNIFFVTVALLLIVLIPGVGSRLLGARRWISLGIFSFQPSELAKLTLAIMIAYAVDKKADFTKTLGLIVLFAGLIMLQPDLGTTIVLVSVGFAQMFIAGFPLQSLLLSGMAGGASGLVLILFSSYRRARLLTFLESSVDPLGASYHMRQILLALGSGGLFGLGLGQSRQKQLFLPETASDSVFAVLAEELGFVGAAILIFILMAFVFRSFKVAKNAPDVFSKVLASGIAMWIGGQMFLNIASMVGITPLTGIPLPFFSYGGSSLVSIMLGIGILLNISKNS